MQLALGSNVGRHSALLDQIRDQGTPPILSPLLHPMSGALHPNRIAVRRHRTSAAGEPMLAPPRPHWCPRPGVPPEVLGAVATTQLRTSATLSVPAAAARLLRGPPARRGCPVRRGLKLPRPYPTRGGRLPTLRQWQPTLRRVVPRSDRSGKTSAWPQLTSCAVGPPPTLAARPQRDRLKDRHTQVPTRRAPRAWCSARAAALPDQARTCFHGCMHIRAR